MLTPEQTKFIEENAKNSEFIFAILRAYARDSTSNTRDLLAFIPGLADMLIYHKDQEIEKFEQSTDLLLAERYDYPKRKTRKGAKFSKTFEMLFRTCLLNFPKGVADGHSEANKAFFNEFLDYLENKRGFDYENEADWKKVMIDGSDSWLKNVIKTNIDPTFEPPTIIIY